MNAKIAKIVISAGELSGDEHAAHVVRAIRRWLPASEFRGMGGTNMRNAGVQTVVDSEESGSVMGFGDVARSLPRILKALSQTKQLIKEWNPDLVILVDYPDFNLRLARYAKKQDIRVLYFIPPSVWAWRAGRIEQIKRNVDAVALIYPFERSSYEERGYRNAYFVGHPFRDEFKFGALTIEERANWFKLKGFNPDRPLVALFPGSREAEIRRHLDIVADTVAVLNRKRPAIQFALALVPTLDRTAIEQSFSKLKQVKIFPGESIDVLRFADVGLLKSGTSNLQAAFARLPFVMFFKAPRFGAFIVKHFVKVREYSIVNLIRSGTVTELLQEQANGPEIAHQIEALLYDSKWRQKTLRGLEEVVQLLSVPDSSPIFAACQSASERVAKLALSLL